MRVVIDQKGINESNPEAGTSLNVHGNIIATGLTINGNSAATVSTNTVALTFDSTSGVDGTTNFKSWAGYLAVTPSGGHGGALTITDVKATGSRFTIANGVYKFPPPATGAPPIVIRGKYTTSPVGGAGAVSNTIDACGLGTPGDTSLVASGATTTQVVVTAGQGSKFPTGAVINVIDGTTGLVYTRKATRATDTISFAAIPNAPAVGSSVILRTDVMMITGGGLTAHYYRGAVVRRLSGVAWRRYFVTDNDADSLTISFPWVNGGTPLAGDTVAIELAQTIFDFDSTTWDANGNDIILDGIALNGVGSTKRFRFIGRWWLQGSLIDSQNGRTTIDNGFLRTVDATEGTFYTTPFATEMPDILGFSGTTGDIEIAANGELGGTVTNDFLSPIDLVCIEGGTFWLVDSNMRVLNQSDCGHGSAGSYSVSTVGAHCYTSAKTGHALHSFDGGSVRATTVDLTGAASDGSYTETGGILRASGLTGAVPGYVFVVLSGGTLIDDGTTTATGTLGYAYVGQTITTGNTYTKAQIVAMGGTVIAAQLATDTNDGLLSIVDHLGLAKRMSVSAPVNSAYYSATGSAAQATATGFANAMPTGIVALLLDFGDASTWGTAQYVIGHCDVTGLARGWLVYVNGAIGSAFVQMLDRKGLVSASTRVIYASDCQRKHLLVYSVRTGGGVVDAYIDGSSDGSVTGNFAGYIAPSTADAINVLSAPDDHVGFPPKSVAVIDAVICPTGTYTATQIQTLYQDTLKRGRIPLITGETWRLKSEDAGPAANGVIPSTWIPVTGSALALTKNGSPIFRGGW